MRNPVCVTSTDAGREPAEASTHALKLLDPSLAPHRLPHPSRGSLAGSETIAYYCMMCRAMSTGQARSPRLTTLLPAIISSPIQASEPSRLSSHSVSLTGARLARACRHVRLLSGTEYGQETMDATLTAGPNSGVAAAVGPAAAKGGVLLLRDSVDAGHRTERLQRTGRLIGVRPADRGSSAAARDSRAASTAAIRRPSRRAHQHDRGRVAAEAQHVNPGVIRRLRLGAGAGEDRAVGEHQPLLPHAAGEAARQPRRRSDACSRRARKSSSTAAAPAQPRSHR